MYQDIKERTFSFAVVITRLVKTLYRNREDDVLTKQVFRSGTSIGANVEEAAASYSRDEYIYKMNIALKEARETHYWLRILRESEIVEAKRIQNIIDESEEIKKVLGAIVSKLRNKSKVKN